MTKSICIFCGKRCHPILDRNSDGTYAHHDCLRQHLWHPDTSVRPEK